MKKRIYYMLSVLTAFVVVGCSESLEDTYDEYIEGGMIRYLGKCSNLEVNPGWERLQVVYKNNIDAGVKQVKITWQSENEETPFVRYVEPKNANPEDLMDTIYLEGLGDAMYTVRVSNISADSTESLIEENYGRPYTRDHEDLRTFTRGISTFGRMGDRLAVMLDQDNDNVDQLVLGYYEVGKEEECLWDIKEHMDDTLTYRFMEVPVGRDYFFLLPEDPNAKIDFNRPLTVKRHGKLVGCIDPIPFEDEVLNMSERLWSTEFSTLMTAKYGTDWENEVENIRELELDYDVTSLQDLMYFPNLEKVILGKNRYMQSAYINSYTSTTDQYIGLCMLSFLKETHPNFVVERYNNHYFGVNQDFGENNLDIYKDAGKLVDDFTIEEKGAINLDEKPTYTPLDTVGWEVTCTNSGDAADTVHNGFAENGAAWLLHDGLRHVVIDYGYFVDEYDEEVYFEPQQTVGAAIITVTFDMKEPQVVKGFKIAQPIRNEKGDPDYLISSMTIEFSTDGYNWTDANYTEGNVDIGNSPAEETYVPVPQSLQTPVRYVRITMNNRPVSTASGQGLYNLRLGKFIPLKELSVTIP